MISVGQFDVILSPTTLLKIPLGAWWDLLPTLRWVGRQQLVAFTPS